MSTDSLSRIHRTNLVLGVASTALAGLLWNGRGMLAAALGASLAIANFWTIRRLGVRAVGRVVAGESPREALILVAGLTVKMAVLCALVWVVIRKLELPVLPFALGLSALVFSILTVGLFLGVDSTGVTVTPRSAPLSAPPARDTQET